MTACVAITFSLGTSTRGGWDAITLPVNFDDICWQQRNVKTWESWAPFQARKEGKGFRRQRVFPLTTSYPFCPSLHQVCLYASPIHCGNSEYTVWSVYKTGMEMKCNGAIFGEFSCQTLGISILFVWTMIFFFVKIHELAKFGHTFTRTLKATSLAIGQAFATFNHQLWSMDRLECLYLVARILTLNRWYSEVAELFLLKLPKTSAWKVLVQIVKICYNFKE